MTIHFAAAQSCDISPLARALSRPKFQSAANDNASDGGIRGNKTSVPSEMMLRAALRHFAEHGLGAAREARAKAETAFFAGDRDGYDWWLGITRTLDRRLAAQAELMGIKLEGSPALPGNSG
ncbi:MAG: hypothetical protein AAF687_03965 [Pseudomonadota bacterium]